MQTPIKQETLEISSTIRKVPSKKDKAGRWSTAQSYLFESLLQRYGKNWKKIHQHMKNRSLGQIRSHAQKFFDKIGTKKVEEYERRAKLLEAYETLEKEKRLREAAELAESLNENKTDQLVKQEEESRFTGEEDSKILSESHGPLIKEQGKQSQQEKIIQEKNQENKLIFPFLESGTGVNCGFLVQFLTKNRQVFNQHQGIEPFIDNFGFNHFFQPKLQ